MRILLILVAALSLAGCEIRSNEIMETTDAASTGTRARGSGVNDASAGSGGSAASAAAGAAKTPGQ